MSISLFAKYKGCFDEFNRISVEVLSVVAVQVKSILNAIKAKRQRFNFMGETISLIPTIGMFITMNPGYAGRTELPENVKSLFRPCAMVILAFYLILLAKQIFFFSFRLITFLLFCMI